jgi:putative CRISPR-associated protein (TIGR02619 family)
MEVHKGGGAMARLVIMPTGISVIRNLEKSGGPKLSLGQQAHQLQSVLASTPPGLERLSVELSILKKLNATKDDKVAFLATDTDDGECAANANARIAQKLFGIETAVNRVSGLVLDNAETFIKKGLPTFFQALDQFVEEASEQGYKPVLGIAGGIKPIIPYAAVYGMFRRIPLVYVFEETQALITLPPLPIDFDWDALKAAERAFRQIEEKVAIPRYQLQKLLGEELPRFEGLFEEVEGDKLTLSAFGYLLLGDLKRSQEMPVMLSNSAYNKLKSLQGFQRRAIDLLLDRVRNPFWRAQKRHTFTNTDLEVYKPGSTSYRLAGWSQDDVMYIAEIYTEHDAYERDLPSRRRNQYKTQDFRAYTPTREEIGEEAIEKAQGDEVVAIALQEQAKAENERAEALQLAARYEQELNHSRELVGQLRERIAELEQEQRERRAWSLWRRLRWAIFGS